MNGYIQVFCQYIRVNPKWTGTWSLIRHIKDTLWHCKIKLNNSFGQQKYKWLVKNRPTYTCLIFLLRYMFLLKRFQFPHKRLSLLFIQDKAFRYLWERTTYYICTETDVQIARSERKTKAILQFMSNTWRSSTEYFHTWCRNVQYFCIIYCDYTYHRFCKCKKLIWLWQIHEMPIEKSTAG